MQDKIAQLKNESKEKEQKLVTAMFMSSGSVMSVLSEINPTDFQYFAAHFQVAIESKIKNKDVYQLAIEKGIVFSDALSHDTFFPNPVELARELKDISRTIQSIGIFESTALSISPQHIQEILADVQQKIVGVSYVGNREETRIVPLVEAFEKKQEEYRSLPPGSIIGISTGVKKIDDMIDGIRAPHVWILAGYTSTGKSFFSLNLIVSIIKQKKKATLYSLEMSKNDVIGRLLGILSNVNGIKIFKGMDNGDIQHGKKVLKESGLNIINDRRDLNQIILSMREQKMIDKTDVFFVDYIQQITVKGADSEYERMSAVSSEFQKLAEELDVPIILVSQVSNEAAKSPNASVMGFKGSGNIAAVADIAIELTSGEENAEKLRGKMMNNEPVVIRVIIKKNRHGRTGYLDLEFDPNTGLFINEPLDTMVREFNGKKIHPHTQ